MAPVSSQSLGDASFWRSVIDQAQEGFWLIDAEGRTVEVNRALTRLLGYSREKFLGRTPMEFADSQNRAVFERQIGTPEDPGQRHFQAGQRQYEVTLVSWEGRPVPVFVHATTLLDEAGEVFGSYAFLTNLSALRSRERELELTRLAVEQSFDGIFWVAPSGQIMDVNETACRRLGYTRNELLSMAVPDLDPNFDPEDWAAHWEDLRRRGQMTIETHHRAKDGTIIPIEVGISYQVHGGQERNFAITRDITERKEAESELRAALSLNQAVKDSIPSGILVVDLQGRVLSANRQFAEMWAIPDEVLEKGDDEALLTHVLDQLADPDGFLERVQALYEDSEAVSWDYIEFKSGRIFERFSQPLLMDGEAQGRVWSFLEITERRRQEHELQQAAAVFANLQEGLLVTDHEGRILQVNPALTRITGYPQEDLIGSAMERLYTGSALDETFADIWATIRDQGAWTGEIRIRTRTGDLHPTWLTANAVHDKSGELTNCVAVVADIAQFKAYEERLAHQAYHDALTDLPNRALFEDRLGHALERLERSKGVAAVIFLDLDEFKNVNDSLGHQAGDRLLQAVAERMARSSRASDTLARVGGDEFLICLEEIPNPEHAVRFAQRLQEALGEPLEIAGTTIRVHCSIGISLYPQDGKTVEDLIRYADAALYSAKEAGRNVVRTYTPDLTERAQERLGLAEQLRSALAGDELVLYYQPQMDLASERPVGLEALIRWQHPELGLLAPVRFVPLAEEMRLIGKLGEWVLHAACRQGRQWLDEGREFGRLAVNVAPQQVQAGDLPETVRECLRESGLPASHLELEFTETALLTELEAASENLRALSELGVRLTVDDFGTGYSSLLYLHRLPVERLKIDKGFVRDLPGSPEAQGIVRAILALAGTLKLEVVAEGVETQEQRDWLLGEGVTIGQGFLWQYPKPAEELP